MSLLTPSLARVARRFLQDPWNGLGLAVNAALLVMLAVKIAQDFGAPGLPPYQTGDVLHMCLASLAVFVWVSEWAAPWGCAW